MKKLFYLSLAFLLLISVAVAAQLDCHIDTPPIQTRIENRDFPSVFMAWSMIQNLPIRITPDQRVTYHDLMWDATYGTQYFSLSNQLIDPENNFYFEKLKTRQMLRENPNLIFIITLPVALIHPDTYLHQKVIKRNDFPWHRDADGNRVPGCFVY